MPVPLPADPHPLLLLDSFEAHFPAPLGELPSPSSLTALLGPGAALEGLPLSHPDDALRAAVRDLLRHGGFKPTGRSKPASEYLRNAVEAGGVGSINLAVDVCNVVSLHSGLPISVVDLDRTRGALRVGIAPPDTQYVFNASGQSIDVSRLLCLFDEEGPCANAVKDAQRTKTTPETRRTRVVLWGTVAAPARVAAAGAWYRALLLGHGAEVDG